MSKSGDRDRFFGTRRTYLMGLVATVMVAAASVHFAPPIRPAKAAHAETRSAPAALAELRAGNLRFVRSARTQSIDTAHDADLRRKLAKGQHPLASILCCADSRVCPEFIFDQRPGSIFEIRNAGNVVDEDVMGSMEYAVEHLHVPIVLVLGHQGCGAIEAVHEAGDKPLHDHLRALQDHMKAIQELNLSTRSDHSAALLNRISKENARQQALALRRESPVLKAATEHGEARLMYGLYDMTTGAVEFFELD